ECLGPECVSMILDWLQTRLAATTGDEARSASPQLRQGLLWKAAPYQEEAPAITTEAELAGAIEHLNYAVFRRYHNQVTRAERARLENTIDNALFKIDRYLDRLEGSVAAPYEPEVRALRESIRDQRERVEHQHRQARRADLKLAQLASLTPES